MKLKKANAILGLLTMAILLIHAGYQVTAYVLFLYDPMVTRILAWAVCVFVIGRTYLILASMP